MYVDALVFEEAAGSADDSEDVREVYAASELDADDVLPEVAAAVFWTVTGEVVLTPSLPVPVLMDTDFTVLLGS